MTNSNFAGDTVPKQETQAFRDADQIKNIEKELEIADNEFLRAADNNDLAGMVTAHATICQLIAKLSASISSNGRPTVFANYHVESRPISTHTAMPPASAATAPPAPTTPPGFVSTDELERQIAALAQQMQKCLEAGDMDGMLKCNERMGELSEMIGRQEAAMKEAAAHAANDPLAKIDEAAGLKDGKGIAAGDTLALARQRAEDRKKQQPASYDVFQEACFGSDKCPSADDLRERLERASFYDILCMPSTASFEELHRNFLRRIRKLNQQLVSRELEDWQFQELVGSLCLSHDVLKYPAARMQYDLTLFGGGDLSPESTTKQKLIPLKELLRFSTLISILDLMDAGDAAEGKHEREMGTYLVEQGKISQEEFDSMLFAQKLVSAGKLTLAQFELAMQELRENQIPLLDTLIASEWIQPSDVLSADTI